MFLKLENKNFPDELKDRRVVIECRGDIAPYTCENFRRLICGEGADSYKGTYLHNCIPGQMLGGGRFDAQLRVNHMEATILPKPDEKGGGRATSAFDGKRFRDENFKLDHAEGTLSSLSDAGTHSSEFFFCLGKEDDYIVQEWNGDHVVFAEVVDGLDVLNGVGELMLSGAWAEIIMRTQMPGYGVCGRPVYPVTIVDCGELAKGAFVPPEEAAPAPDSLEARRRNMRASRDYKKRKASRIGSMKRRGTIEAGALMKKKLDILASGGDIMSTFEKQTESEAAFMKRWSPTRGPAAEESKAGPGVPATG